MIDERIKDNHLSFLMSIREQTEYDTVATFYGNGRRTGLDDLIEWGYVEYVPSATGVRMGTMRDVRLTDIGMTLARKLRRSGREIVVDDAAQDTTP